MNISKNAIDKFKTFVTPNSSTPEGIRIVKVQGCCGQSFQLSVVKEPNQDDIPEIHDGMNIYLDNSLSEFRKDIIIDFENEYFQIKGIENNSAKRCC